MLLGIPWYALVGIGAAVIAVFVVARRKAEGNASYGQAGAEAVKLGRLY